MLKPIVLSCVLMLQASNLSAALIFEDFSSGLNGWGHIQTSGSSSTGGTSGTLDPKSIIGDGGPSGIGDNYLQYQDVDSNFMHAIFGNGWSGDLSAYNNGLFSFDFIQTAPSFGTSFIASFGFLRVTGGGLTFGTDVIPDNPSTDWQNQSFSFSAATFGATEQQWSTVLANVTEIRLNVESWNGIEEFVGLDNVSLRTRAVDGPASAWLFSLGIFYILLIARGRQ